jgi:hypothetical protein
MSSRQQRRRLQRRRASTRAIRIGTGALALTLVPVAAAQAKTIKVTSRQDSGSGTLRAAITEVDADANDTSPAKADLITFASNVTGSIDLLSPLPDITDSIDIHGPGARKLTISGKSIPSFDEDSILFDDESPAHTTLTVVGLSFIDGNEERGAFIDADHSNLKLVGDSFSHGTASLEGGAVYNFYGDLTVEDCTFTHNHAQVGGAIEAGHGETTISDSTIAGNSARSAGAGLALVDTDNATVTGATITGNSVLYSGDGPYGYGGGVSDGGGKLSLQDSIVAGNSATGNPAIAFKRYGSLDRDVFIYDGGSLNASFSLIQHDTRGLKGLNSTDITGKSPDLGPLRNNGGSTDTELPKLKSPVINVGKAFGLKTDQRGLKRTVKYPGRKLRKGSDGTDIGAVELQAPKKKRK